MKKHISLIIVFFGLILLKAAKINAQKINEFEGEITYEHLVTVIKPGFDAGNDYGYIGKHSEFYYKDGKYKWINLNAYMQMDMFRSKDTVEFLKMESTDTILYARNNVENETVLDHQILKNADTILGHICNVLVIKAKANGSEWTRRYSFSDEFPVNPELFGNYKHNSTNFIYARMKALPLKIELIYADRIISFTAIKIEKKALPESLFEFDPKTKFRNLM